MRTLPAVLLASLCVASCSHRTSPADFSKMTEEFVYKTLSFSPVFASGQGLHEYNNVSFDTQLDDMSGPAIIKARNFFADFHKRLQDLDKNSLSPEDRADYDIIDAQIGLSLFDLDIARSYQHSPQSYVELIGTALYNPFLLDYAPKDQRFGHIIARMKQVPAFIANAQRQLRAMPDIWRNVAVEENTGNIDLIDKTLRADVPAALKDQYEAAAAPAVEALQGFSHYLKTGHSNPNDPASDWRLGPNRYATKFRLALATDRTPDQVLADAEARLKAVRAQMLELSLPLHAKWFAAHKDHADQTGGTRENTVISEVLNHIAQDHSTPASYMDDARKDLDQARNFTREKNLLTLPAGSNLQVIPTPEFQRGIYAVGGFNPAPVFQPQLGAYFWITPIPPDWPKERVESKLREYNFYNLQLLTIHEAMPGHYVQFEFANQVQPKIRGALRALFSNGPYVEGWAQYITQVMLDEGYMNSAPELRLTLLKQELRVDANAIMDIRLQTNRMT
ncbi:MAG TPA: DUF885 domain-containing protein, partial [Bryobacteraceae bacterium]|nr:DUF885 domain-containing protein [Bryobacteraceae bacterium]